MQLWFLVFGVKMKYRATCYSTDGTIKYMLDVPARDMISSKGLEASIEAAFIPLPGREDGKSEYTLCLSSQIGCVYRCHMCKNMFASFYGALSSQQLNEQITLVLSLDKNLEKVVAAGSVEYAFMAMGEPLFGGSVIRAIQNHIPMVKDTRFALSTVGAEGTIRKLAAADLPFPVRIEVSLHFSDDATRVEWLEPNMWFFNARPVLRIAKTLAEAEEYAQKRPGKVTLNYALIDGINNMDRNVAEIARLLKGRESVFYVKVMRPNLTSSFVFSHREFDTPQTYGPEAFAERLRQVGIPVTVFESKGQDITAGCGMMTVNFGGKRGVFTPEHIPQADPSKLGY